MNNGIPEASRPSTAFPWNEGHHDLKKLVEEAVLAAFESNAFKIGVAAQVDPAFSRQQEKMNQIKTANLNLESMLQAHVEDLPGILKPIQDHLTAVNIPDYGQELEKLSQGQQRLEAQFEDFAIPDYGKEMSEISSGQSRLLKLLETRFGGLESRFEELDRKIDGLEENVVNADLRSAIRFGEISNELQDRNTTLSDRVWEIERNLGRKIDGQQRKVVSACEELGNTVRTTSGTLETIQSKMEHDDVLGVLQKSASRAENSELTLRQHVLAIQDKISNLDTSSLISQSRKLEAIEREMSGVKKALEVAGNVASLDSKLLSDSTSRLDSIISIVGEIKTLAETTYEISHDISESQELNTTSMKEDNEAVKLHVRALDNLATSHLDKLQIATSSLSRIEESMSSHEITTAEKLGGLVSGIERIEKSLTFVPSHSEGLDDIKLGLRTLSEDKEPHKEILNAITSTISALRSTIDTSIASHDSSLKAIQKRVSDSSSFDHTTSKLLEIQSILEHQSTASSEVIRTETSKVLQALEDSKNHSSHNHDHLTSTLGAIDQSNAATQKTLTHHAQTLQELADNNKAILDVATHTKNSYERHSKVLDSLVLSAESTRETTASTKDIILTQSETIDKLSDSLRILESDAHVKLEAALSSLECLRVGFGERTLHSELQDLASNLQAHVASFDQMKQSHETTMATIQNIHDRQHHDTASIKTNIGRSIEALQIELSTSIEEHHKTALQESQSWKEAIESLRVKLNGMFESSQAGLSAAASREDVVLLQTTVLNTLDSLGRSLSQKEDIERLSKSLGGSLEGLQETALNSHTSRDEEIVTMQTAVLQALQRNDATLREIAEFKSVAELSSKVNEMVISVSDEIKKLDESLNSTSMATVREIADRIGGLDRKLQDDIESIAEAAKMRLAKIQGPLAEVLEEIRSNKAFLETEKAEMLAEIQSTKKSVEASKAAQVEDTIVIKEILEESKNRSHSKEILRQIDALEQKSTSRHSTCLSALTKSLENSEQRDEALQQSLNTLGLDLSSKISTSSDILAGEVRSLDLASIIIALESLKDDMHTSFRETHDDTSIVADEIKSMMASSVTTFTDTSTGSAEAHRKALRESAIALSRLEDSSRAHGTSLMETLSTIRESLGLVSQTKDDVRLIVTGIQDIEHITRSNATSLATIEALAAPVASQLHFFSKEVKTGIAANRISVLEAIKETHSALSDETRIAISSNVTSLLAATKETHSALSEHEKTLRGEVSELHREITSLSDLMVRETGEAKTAVAQKLDSVKIEVTGSLDLVKRAVEKGLDESNNAHDLTLVKITSESKSLADAVRKESQSTVEAITSVKETIGSEAQKARTSLDSSISQISSNVKVFKFDIQEEIKCLEKKTIDKFVDLETSVKIGGDTTSTAINASNTSLQSAMSNLSGGQKAIDAAVRVNSAAISRVDKAVLETGSQIKFVIRDTAADSNKQVLQTLSQLDSELHDNCTRVREIAEFNMPRLEAIGKRNRDALEVIGGRALGTTKKFGEMVTRHAQKLPVSLEESTLLGNRLRSPSAASSRGSRGDEF